MDLVTIIPIITTVVILLPILALIIYRIKLKSDKGNYGEIQIQAKLNKYIKKKGGYLINDVIIPGKNDKTSEIDHILFYNNGVFVIETKNLSGLIYGKEEDEYFIQVLGDGTTRNRIYNPIKQNSTHVDRVQYILNINNVINVVVFNQNNTSHIKSKYIIKKRKLIRYLKSYKENLYSNEQVQTMYNKIKQYKDYPIISKEEHIKRIQERKENGSI